MEAGELLEHLQWKSEMSATELDEKKEAIGDEVADILVYLIELTDVVGLDLEQAVLSKLAKNEQKYPVEKARNS